MTIRVLSPLVTNQIAAGEVVERPASVIKEMVENSLDAGATKIDIEIAGGGKSLIKIRDNGCGIPKDELALALTRHATSKIVDVDDLSAIVSFGFRGEALASVASVSRLTLTSKPHDQSEAWQITAEGVFEEPDIQPASHPDGTTITVRDLFFNVPPRRRFLKSDRTEIQHIVHLFKTFALGNAPVAFSLVSDGKTLFSLPPAVEEKQRQQRLVTLFGKAFISDLLSVYLVRDGLSLSGFVLPAKPDESTDVEAQFLFLNGRPIREKNTMHAIRQAYTEIYGREVKINYVLFLTMDPSEVDVNVHPTKHEVRFADQRTVHDFFVIAVHQALSMAGIAPDEAVNENHHDYMNSRDGIQCAAGACETADDNSGASGEVNSGSAAGSFSGFSGIARSSYGSSGSGSSGGCRNFTGASNTGSSGAFNAYADWMSSMSASDSMGAAERKDPETVASAPVAVLYGVSENSACAGYGQNLYIFRLRDLDRICLKDKYKTGSQSSALIIPQQLKPGAGQTEALRQNENTVSALGFSLQFRGDTVRIVCVPDCLRRYDVAGMLAVLSDALEKGTIDEETLRTAIIDAAVAKRSYALVDAVNLLFNSGIDLDSFFNSQDRAVRLDAEQLIKDQNVRE